MTPDSSRYYGTVSRLLHWLMAACFVVMLVTAIIWNLTEADWVAVFTACINRLALF